jgi:hypothetical protein
VPTAERLCNRQARGAGSARRPGTLAAPKRPTSPRSASPPLNQFEVRVCYLGRCSGIHRKLACLLPSLMKRTFQGLPASASPAGNCRLTCPVAYGAAKGAAKLAPCATKLLCPTKCNWKSEQTMASSARFGCFVSMSAVIRCGNASAGRANGGRARLDHGSRFPPPPPYSLFIALPHQPPVDPSRRRRPHGAAAGFLLSALPHRPMTRVIGTVRHGEATTARGHRLEADHQLG